MFVYYYSSLEAVCITFSGVSGDFEFFLAFCLPACASTVPTSFKNLSRHVAYIVSNEFLPRAVLKEDNHAHVIVLQKPTERWSKEHIEKHKS